MNHKPTKVHAFMKPCLYRSREWKLLTCDHCGYTGRPGEFYHNQRDEIETCKACMVKFRVERLRRNRSLPYYLKEDVSENMSRKARRRESVVVHFTMKSQQRVHVYR